MKIKFAAPMRVIHLSIVTTLLSSLMSFIATPANAVADGTVACSGGGTFTITSNIVTGNTGCTGSAVVPEGVTALGTSFYNSALSSITLPSTLVTIGDSALRETQLVSVVIPASVTSIGFLSLATRGITSVTFAAGSQLTTIGSDAFQSTSFASITIPALVSSIGSTAFLGNANLTTINFLGSIPAGTPWSAGNASVSTVKLICDGSSRTCQVGENGPGGGTIYYYSSGGFNCGPTQSDSCNYLEVAPSTWSSSPDPTKPWANATEPNYDYEIPDVTKAADPPPLTQTDIGLGYKDSIAIVANGRGDTSTTAAYAARAFRGGSKSDWYLPSPVELNLLCQWAQGVPSSITTSCTAGTLNSATYGASTAGFQGDLYWTSTQANGYPSYAYSRNFRTGSSYSALKNFTAEVRVRPIRAFGGPRFPTKVVITQASAGTERRNVFTTQPRITIQDASNYTVTSSTAVVTATITSGSGGTLIGSDTATAVSGVATFSGLGINGTVGTTYTITYSSSGLTSATATVTLTGTSCDGGSFTCQVGDTGPGGGKIFYVAPTTFTQQGATGSMCRTNCKYIEAAPNDWFEAGPDPGRTWSTETVTVTGAVGTAIGYGYQNSEAIKAQTINTTDTSAAVLARAYQSVVSGVTYRDWFLPSKDELGELTLKATTVLLRPQVIGPIYWSSSQSSDIHAWESDIYDGPLPTLVFREESKSSSRYVRPIRAFAPPAPTPTIAIGTTNFMPRVATNVGVVLTGFDETLSYQATVKFVNATTNADVSNGTLAAARGSTTLISGYTSYSSAKLGFKGTYAQIAAALASMTWNPATAAADIRMRIGISTVPGTNEFYDANSGRYYRFVPAATTWTQARTNAEATTLFGLRGYLAEITSAAENAFIANETSAFNIWMGATEDAVTAVGTDGKGGWTGTSYNGSVGQRWIWNGAVETPLPVGTGAIAQGPATAFSAWRNVGTIEPNNDAKPGADCGVTNWGARGVWNDRPCSVAYSYLIEFGGRPGESSTAIGATLTTAVSAGVAVQYTITYNPNSGNTTPTQASLTTGQTFNLANAISRNASGGTTYEFAGWRSGSVIYKAGDPITVGTANLAYTAVWVQLYEVTYVVNGGTFSGSDTVNDDQCTAGANRCTNNQSITLNAAPTRAGYTFDGWKDQSGAAIVDANSGVAEVQTVVTSTNYIFTATWTPITYTITYVSSGSTAPTQGALREGQSFTVAAAATKAGFEFTGWNDGTFTFLPDSDFTVQTSSITLTAQWSALYTVTYSQGLGSGTPATEPASYSEGSEIIIDTGSGISRSGFTFAGWNDGMTTFQPGASYTVGTSNVTLTAQWTAIPVAPTPAPVVVPTPVAPVGPPPSVLKTITNPKISRDDKGYYCQVGKYVFLREGRTEETPKLTTQVFSLLSNGTVIDSIKSALDKVLFTKSDTYLESTLTCQVDVGQENLMATSYSLNSADISAFATSRKSAIEGADVKYYKDREDAYAKKDQEFVRLAAVRSAAVLASKSSREVSAASSNYQKAYKAASELWKKELADASTNRVLAKELAQKIYLESLESAGISIYPTPVKAIVTPTPTPTPTPKPTPTPTPTPVVTTNPQPTSQMVKVGTVYMATGSYSLNDATKIILKAIALKINASDAKSILVYGHTDSRGGVNNTVLSQNRAKAVANYLRPLLKGKKITVGWYASRKPVAGGNSVADLAKNRRVEIYSK